MDNIILNIETSSDLCSVALTSEGTVLYQQNEPGINHAKLLAVFVDRCMDYLKTRELKLSAVAVSIGPGSYTGLRIGLSLAKGLCFGMGVPLIGVSTLEIMAVAAMFKRYDFTGNELLVPMLDARRMEVYTAIYDFALNAIEKPHPLVIDQNSFSEYLKDRSLYFMGNGSDKMKGVIMSENAHYIEAIKPTAIDMMALSEKALREKKFLDIAYSVPLYLKEFQATTPKNKI